MRIGVVLLLILAISLFLRLWGIQNNLPYVEFSDELSIGEYAVNMAKTGDISKYCSHYPPFHTYLQALSIFLYSAIKGCSIESLSRAETYLVFRIVVAILGTIGVFATYLLGKTVGNKTTGVISAALLGGIFVHAVYSSQVKNDVPEALLGTLAIFFSVQFINRNKQNDLFFAAFFAALAFSTHHFGIFYVVPVGVAYFLNLFDNKGKFNQRHFLFSGSVLLAGFILGFFVGSPIYLFNPLSFFQMLSVPLELFKRQPILPDPAWAFYAKYSWHYGLYYPLFLISVLGIIFCLIKRTKGYICILSFLFVYGIAIFTNKLHYTDRLTIPLTPVLAVVSAVFLTYLYEKFKETNLFSAQWLPKYLGVTLLVALLAVLYARIGIGDYYLARPSSLHQLEEWMDSYVPPGSRVLFTVTPLCFSPNDLEEKYAVSYYLPELSRRPLGSLATRFDYVILYWAFNLPAEWVKEIEGNATLKVGYLPPKTGPDWLNPIATNLSNPFFIVRSNLAQPVSLYYLGDIPRNDCVVVTNVFFTRDTCKGSFQLIKGNKPADDRIEVVYSTPLFLAGAEGVEKEVTEDFKSFKGSVNYNFVWEAKEGRIRLYELRTDGTQVEINYNLAKYQHLIKGFRDNLYKRFNLDNLIRGEFLGQDGKDYCSLGGFIKPSGQEDIHIRVTGAKKSVKRVKVTRGEITLMGPFNGAYPPVYFVQEGEVVECYFEQWGYSRGRLFEISLIYEDGTVAIAQTYGIATGPDVATHRDGDRIVVYKLDRTTVELYDLVKDPTQENNLVAGNPEKAEELKRRYFSLESRTGKSIEVVNMEQGEADLVGTYTEGSSGRKDIHIMLLGPDRPILKVRMNMGDIIWAGPLDGLHYYAKFVQKGSRTDIYFEPAKEKVESVKVTVIFEDKLYATATFDKRRRQKR